MTIILFQYTNPFKEVSVIITASLTLLMLEWAVYSMFDEIDSFERTMRAELDEFEVNFPLVIDTLLSNFECSITCQRD